MSRPALRPRPLRPGRFRRLLNLYPPLLFQRIRVLEIADDFSRLELRVARSYLTRNLQGTTFGGTLYAAADPFFALLYWQRLMHDGVKVHSWVRDATVRFRRPAASAVRFTFAIDGSDVEDAIRALRETGRFSRVHGARGIDEDGEVCVEIDVEVVLKLADGAAPVS